MTRAQGIDIYQAYQPNYVPQKHHTFVTIKVAEGKYVVQHERVWEQAEPIPINIAYLYLRSGVPALEQADALIGASAVIKQLPLITGNEKHYKHLPEIRVQKFQIET